MLGVTTAEVPVVCGVVWEHSQEAVGESATLLFNPWTLGADNNLNCIWNIVLVRRASGNWALPITLHQELSPPRHTASGVEPSPWHCIRQLSPPLHTVFQYSASIFLQKRNIDYSDIFFFWLPSKKMWCLRSLWTQPFTVGSQLYPICNKNHLLALNRPLYSAPVDSLIYWFYTSYSFIVH